MPASQDMPVIDVEDEISSDEEEEAAPVRERRKRIGSPPDENIDPNDDVTLTAWEEKSDDGVYLVDDVYALEDIVDVRFNKGRVSTDWKEIELPCVEG